MCLALLDAEGEVSGIHLAQAILDRYAELDGEQKRAFFDFLNDDLEVDIPALESAVRRYAETGDLASYRKLGLAAEPRRQDLLRRLNQPRGATRAIVQMRTDLLSMLGDAPELARTDLDFRHLLRSWFNRGFLTLRQISWHSPPNTARTVSSSPAIWGNSAMTGTCRSSVAPRI